MTAIVSDNQKRASWQRSIARRTEAYLDDAIKIATARSTLLQADEPRGDIARFHRSEILVGPLLGQGAFSEVYPIREIKLRAKEGKDRPFNSESEESRQLLCRSVLEPPPHDRYVIKHLRKALASHRRKFHHAAVDLMVEAKFLSRLDHPNIIKIRGWASGETSSYEEGSFDGFFVILDQVDLTLSQQLDSWRSEPEYSTSAPGKILKGVNDRLNYALQVATALDYMHDKCIIYRDLKPDNIGIKMGELSDNVLLFDFGLCREIPKQTQTGNEESFHLTRVGTRRYMSPEVYLGKPYNLKADVYSFSIVLHELISLQIPYRLYNEVLHLMLVCDEGVRPNVCPEWPHKLREILETGWATNPWERISIKEVCHRLIDLISELEEPANDVELCRRFEMIDGSTKPPCNSELTSSTLSSSCCGSLKSIDF